MIFFAAEHIQPVVVHANFRVGLFFYRFQCFCSPIIVYSLCSIGFSILFAHLSSHAMQLQKSLVAETKGTKVGCHLISPGMILTRLLMRHAHDSHARFAFEVLADLPHVVAGELAPQILATVGTDTRIVYLTHTRAFVRMLFFWLYRGRFFDEDGNCKIRIE